MATAISRNMIILVHEHGQDTCQQRTGLGILRPWRFSPLHSPIHTLPLLPQKCWYLPCMSCMSRLGDHLVTWLQGKIQNASISLQSSLSSPRVSARRARPQDPDLRCGCPGRRAKTVWERAAARRGWTIPKERDRG